METAETKELKNKIIDIALEDFKDCPSIIAKPRKYWYDRIEFTIYNNRKFYMVSSIDPQTLIKTIQKNKSIVWRSMVKLGKGEYQIVSTEVNDYFHNWLQEKIFEK